MPRFADSKEIVANEDVEPVDAQYRRTLSSPAECRIDTAEAVGAAPTGSTTS